MLIWNNDSNQFLRWRLLHRECRNISDSGCKLLLSHKLFTMRLVVIWPWIDLLIIINWHRHIQRFQTSLTICHHALVVPYLVFCFSYSFWLRKLIDFEGDRRLCIFKCLIHNECIWLCVSCYFMGGAMNIIVSIASCFHTMLDQI